MQDNGLNGVVTNGPRPSLYIDPVIVYVSQVWIMDEGPENLSTYRFPGENNIHELRCRKFWVSRRKL